MEPGVQGRMNAFLKRWDEVLQVAEPEEWKRREREDKVHKRLAKEGKVVSSSRPQEWIPKEENHPNTKDCSLKET